MGSTCCKTAKRNKEEKLTQVASRIEKEEPRSEVNVVETDGPMPTSEKAEKEQIGLAVSQVGSGSQGSGLSAESTVLSSSFPPVPVQWQAEAAEKLPQALNNLAVRLYAKFDMLHHKENFVFSPLSIAFALSLVESSTGNMQDHPTRDKLQKLIGPIVSNAASYRELYGAMQRRVMTIPGAQDSLRGATSIICDNGIKMNGDYSKNLYDSLKTEVLSAPLNDDPEAARKQINGWFSEKTNDTVSDIVKIGRIHAGTSILFLVTATYAKMKWDAEFDVAVTKLGTFYQFGVNDPKRVPFAVRAGNCMGYVEGDNVQVVEIPYVRQVLSVYVMVPKHSDGISAIEKQLDATHLIDLFKSAVCDPMRQVHLEMPHVNIRSQTELIPVLKAMGIQHLNHLFLLTKEYRVRVSDAIHDACFEMGEITLIASSEQYMAKNGSIPVIADHPYLFAIVHKPDWSTVFMGKVNRVEN